MKRALLVTALAVATTSSVVAPALAAGSVAAKAAPKPPVSGHWRVNHEATNDIEASGGGFVVTKGHRAVKGLSIILGSQVETACGTGTIKVLGSHKIIDAKGLDSEGDHYNEWVVGKNTPSSDTVIAMEKVTLARAGNHFKGDLRMVWSSPHGGTTKKGYTSYGEITFNSNGPDGACDFSFGVKKG